MNFPTSYSPELIKIPPNRQKTLFCVITWLIIFPISTLSQNVDSSSKSSDSISKFKPTLYLALVVGALCMGFSLLCVILFYVYCCHISYSVRLEGNLPRTRSMSSGIQKSTIDSLPSFKFSTLKGEKNGLVCSVCLSSFEDEEVLRLLPKCKHAFHINCIDKWLEKHSSCPLCRVKLLVDDIALFTNYSNSFRLDESEPSSSNLL